MVITFSVENLVGYYGDLFSLTVVPSSFKGLFPDFAHLSYWFIDES